MTTLYNCHPAGDAYRITKFDSDLNVLASYLTTATECDCPAGVRPTCRHRAMLPRFLAHGHIGDGWTYDYDRNGWVHMVLPDQLPATEPPQTFSRRGL